MSCGSLPPVPGLIPISALRKSPSCNNNDLRECTPCAAQKEVMGEQRSRRTGSQPSVDLIDIARRSRGVIATPQAPSGKARAERHRKSDRRRERRGGRKRSTSKRREVSPPEDKCVNPRVNPIFVWVRQEDTHIVDVKCEDYDKRNRIVLTKTAQGWRAIPRTETLVPNLKAAAAVEEDESNKQQQQQQTRRLRKNSKVKRKSAAVQVDDDVLFIDEHRMDVDPPAWNVPVNIESHLPSHTIQVQRKRSPSPEEIVTEDDATANVNTSAGRDYNAQASAAECSASKLCDVSPLDNLLAVAELEFNQQIQTEAWCESTDDTKTTYESRTSSKNFEVSITLINKTDGVAHRQSERGAPNDFSMISQSENFDSEIEKDDDCDYNEDDENNLAMDDILTRLEQSLQSPDVLCPDDAVAENEQPKQSENASSAPDDTSTTSYRNEDYRETDEATKTECKEDSSVGSTVVEDTPTDLSTSKKVECLSINMPDDDLMPTDLSVPKKKSRSPSPTITSPRPSSRCSETIQSPQPSGLPAIPHSPDVQTASKSAYLESLLSSTSQKMSLNSEVTITRQKEPLDFGKCRKSASPTVTCSEEITTSTSSAGNNNKDGEPESKRGKLDDITLRTILDATTIQTLTSKEECKVQQHQHRVSKSAAPETSRLLELLTSESEPDALAQLKQLQSDANINIPDPMLVPKDRLSQILMSPGKEIPRLLSQRPELRLPEALAFPHLLQDPDILVITISQLETIIRKQSALSVPVEKSKQSQTKKSATETNAKNGATEKDRVGGNVPVAAKQHRDHAKQVQTTNAARTNELCGDAAANNNNNNALNQMMWLPYLHQLEVAAMAFGNGADFLKMLSSTFPPYTNQVPDMSQMFSLNRFPQPTGFPLPHLPNNFNNNPFELPVWHETPNPPNLQQRSNQYDNRHSNKIAYREYVEKMALTGASKTHQSSGQKYPANHKTPSYHPAPSMYHQQGNPPLHNMQNPFIGVPTTYQPPNVRSNLQIPQYSSILTQKNPMYGKGNGKTSPSVTNSNCDLKMTNAAYRASNNQRYNTYNQKLSSLVNSHKSKASFNPLEALQKNLSSQEGFKKSGGAGDFVAQQPIDLSGSTAGKSRHGKQNFCDSVGIAKSLKFDDVPEVGSTTASIEDMTAHMQDSQKHLWHPLFGNQKSSSNPWNWTTVTATGE